MAEKIQVEHIPMIFATYEEIRKARENLKNEILRRMVELKIVEKETDAHVRDIWPTDLGKTSSIWKMSYATGDAWENYVSGFTVGDKNVLGLYAIAPDKSNALTIGIKIYTPTEMKTIQFFQAVYNRQEPYVLLNPGVIFNKGETFSIDLYGKATGDDYVVLMGLIGEPAGTTITK